MRMNSCHGEDAYVICDCYLEEDLELMGSDRICTALPTYGQKVCPLSTLCLFWVSLVEGDLSGRYDSSRSYHQ